MAQSGSLCRMRSFSKKKYTNDLSIEHQILRPKRLSLVNMFSNKIFSKHYLRMIFEPVHEISNNVVCAASKTSDQPAHTRSLIRAFAGRLSIL